MLQTTLQKYRTRAHNFYLDRCDETSPTSAQICAALLGCAQEYRPNSFSTLKSALANDQLIRNNPQAAKEIRELVNPTTVRGSELPRKPKPPKVRTVSEADFIALLQHLRAKDFLDEALCVVLAYYLGVRPCEMRTISVNDNRVHIIGGKKSASLERGADRTLSIDTPEILSAIADASRWMKICPRSNTAIRDRLRKECRLLWPRRKHHPTLKSFRHQLGSNLKASGESAERLAYIMGHQSTSSINAYGNRRSGASRTLYINTATNADLSKVRKPAKLSTPERGNIFERIAASCTTWKQPENRNNSGRPPHPSKSSSDSQLPRY